MEMNRRTFLKMGIGLSAASGLMAACGSAAATPKTDPAKPAETAPTAAPAAGAGAAGAVDKSKLAKELSWYTWGGYESPDVFKAFEKEYGVKVKVDTYSSNEELEAKFKAGGNPGYDLITPSDYMVAKLVASGLLEKIDYSNIPNFSQIDPGHKGLYFDTANEYTVAYNWGCTGFAYNKSKVKEPITSWKQVMAWPDELKGKLGMLDDMRELLGMALRFNGASGNTDKAAEIETAKKALIDLKKRVNFTLTDSPGAKTNIVAGDSIGSMIYTNDAIIGKGELADLVYVIPGDVSTVWQDNNCIPKGAPNKYTAEVFLDFLCRADICGQLSNELGLGTPNMEAIKQGLINKELIQDKAVYPDLVGMKDKLDYLRKGDPAIDELFQRAFDEIKSA
jgi:spermidine/putrescine transport system substrate-binding protein